MVTGQKVRWVLDLMRGTGVRGSPGDGVRHRRGGRVRRHRLAGSGPGREPLRSRGTESAHPLPRARPTSRCACGCWSRRNGGCCSTRGRSPGSGGRASKPSTATPPAGTVVATEGALANEHLRVAVDRRPARTRSRRMTASGSQGSVGSSTAATAATPTTTPRRPSTRIVDTPDHGADLDPRVRSRAGPSARRDATTPGRRPRSATRSRARRAPTRPNPTTVRTTLELHPGERFVRVTHDFDNRSRDHRLRAHFPLPAPVAGSDAECAFTVVHRGLTAEGGAHEFGLPTFVSRRFVDATDGTKGLRAPARRPPRIRSRRRRPRDRAHTAARDGLPVAVRTVVAPEPRRTDRPGEGSPDAR